MRKTRYYITKSRAGGNYLLQHSNWMYKYNPMSQAWEVSDFWYDEIVMNAFTDYEEISEDQAKTIIANGGIFDTH